MSGRQQQAPFLKDFLRVPAGALCVGHLGGHFVTLSCVLLFHVLCVYVLTCAFVCFGLCVLARAYFLPLCCFPPILILTCFLILIVLLMPCSSCASLSDHLVSCARSVDGFLVCSYDGFVEASASLCFLLSVCFTCLLPACLSVNHLPAWTSVLLPPCGFCGLPRPCFCSKTLPFNSKPRFCLTPASCVVHLPENRFTRG